MNRTTRAKTPFQSLRRIELHGEYDLRRKSELESIVASLTADGPAIVDMTRVSYVDSTFLHALVTLYYRFKDHGVTLVGANAAIRRVLAVVKFDQLFRILDS